jgi:hypothetical protein
MATSFFGREPALVESLVGARGLFTLPAAAMPNLGATSVFAAGPFAAGVVAGLAVVPDVGVFFAGDEALLVPVVVPVPTVDRDMVIFLAGLAVVDAGFVTTLRGGEVAGVAVPVRLAIEDAVGVDRLVVGTTLAVGFGAGLAVSSVLRALEEAVGAANRLAVAVEVEVPVDFGFAGVVEVVVVDLVVAGAVAFGKVEGRETGGDFAFDVAPAGFVIAVALPLAAVEVVGFIFLADFSSRGGDLGICSADAGGCSDDG